MGSGTLFRGEKSREGSVDDGKRLGVAIHCGPARFPEDWRGSDGKRLGVSVERLGVAFHSAPARLPDQCRRELRGTLSRDASARTEAEHRGCVCGRFGFVFQSFKCAVAILFFVCFKGFSCLVSCMSCLCVLRIIICWLAAKKSKSGQGRPKSGPRASESN